MYADINDVRSIKDFRGGSFSQYKIADVKTACIKELNQSNIKNSYYWIMDLVCSGHIKEAWEILIGFYANSVNVGNPKLAIYLNMMHNNYNIIHKGGYVNYELAMRNNHEIRKLFCEIVIVLCASNKTPTFEKIKIKGEDNFNIEALSDKLKAPDVSYVNRVFRDGDPNELYIPVNEFIYSISKDCSQKSLWNTLFWLEWVLEYCKYYNKIKEKVIVCAHRKVPVLPIFQKDVIWIIWDCLLDKEHTTSDIQNKCIFSLFSMFVVNYKPGSKDKRKQLLYFACKILIDKNNIDFKIPIIKDIEKYNGEEVIECVFEALVKKQQEPNTGYLSMDGDNRTNVEKTVEKLASLDKFMNM